MNKPRLMEATQVGFSPICSRERAAGICRQTALRPMSEPEGRFPRVGSGRKPGSARAFLFLPPWRPIRFLAEGKNAASLKQIRAALSFAYQALGFKQSVSLRSSPRSTRNPRFATCSSLIFGGSWTTLRPGSAGIWLCPRVPLGQRPFQTACRFMSLIQLEWSDFQAVGEEIVALRIKGKGSVFQDVPVPGSLSAALLEWKASGEF